MNIETTITNGMKCTKCGSLLHFIKTDKGWVYLCPHDLCEVSDGPFFETLKEALHYETVLAEEFLEIFGF